MDLHSAIVTACRYRAFFESIQIKVIEMICAPVCTQRYSYTLLFYSYTLVLLYSGLTFNAKPGNDAQQKGYEGLSNKRAMAYR